MSKDQMVAEFGEPGVQNPMVVDLITTDASSGAVVLVMVERRAWGEAPEQFRQIEEKINRYMGYALDGFLVQHYPQYAKRPVCIRLDCKEAPHDDATRFVEAARHAIEAHRLAFAVQVTG